MRRGIRDNDWIRTINHEYGSLEKFVEYMHNAGAVDPLIIGYASFEYLLKKGLLKEDDIIRTNLEGGSRDGHYRVTKEGKLEGVEAAGGSYSGDSGIHNPIDILSIERADHGWTINSHAKTRIIRSIEQTS
jgi:hypothetical protein